MNLEFSEKDIALITKLQNDPAVLLLGQSYYELGCESNLVLNALVKKYNVNPEKGMSCLFEIENVSGDAVRGWMQKLFDNISVPDEIVKIANYPWSHVYTTAIDNILLRAFKSDLRSIQPIFSSNYKVSDPRSRSNMHLTYLYGQVQFSDAERASPLKKLAKNAREAIAGGLLSRLQREIVSPKGVLIIEGWNPATDWLTSENLYKFLVTFGKSQVHIFSADRNYRDEFLNDLIEKQIVILHEEKLADFIERAIVNKKLEINTISSDEEGTWLTLSDKKVRVPDEIIRIIKKAALLLTSSNFDIDNSLENEDKSVYFKNFISFSSTIPDWRGYTRGLAFRREFVDTVLNLVSSTSHDNLILVHGQASSGKTIGLGQIAYESTMSPNNKMPVLFIERSYKRLDENAIKAIDEFGLWAEENGAEKTLIIYDGMLNHDVYMSLLNNLITRGRKILLIGSSYLNDNRGKNFINVDIELSQNEKRNFSSFIGGVVKETSALQNIIQNQSNKNFLSVLYHYLPESKGTINELIRNEARYYLDNVRETYTIKSRELTKDFILKNILETLGFSSSESNSIDTELTIGGESGEMATHFVNLVMCVGKHGLSTPFELTIRALGDDSLKADFFNAIPSTDFIRWRDDHNGNITVGPRTTLEATIYTYTLGGLQTEKSFLIKILEQIKDSGHTTQEDIEIEFASQLLQILKKNGSPFRKYMHEFADVLGTLRRSKQAVHPRLMLQEASLLQESIKEPDLPNSIDKLKLLEQAEDVIQQALEIESTSSSTFVYLQVEKASILASMAKQSPDKSLAIKLFEEARQVILNFQFTTSNYHALDILLWSIRDQAYLTKNVVALNKLRADAEHFLQFGSEEGFNVLNSKFYERQQELGEVFKDVQFTEEAFMELKKLGSKAGYFLKAKGYLAEVNIYENKIFDPRELSQIRDALSYLNDNFNEIKLDRQCLYLYLKLWWLSKNHQPIFYTERTLLKLDHDEWMTLLSICTMLLEITEMYISTTVKYLKGIAEFHVRSDNYTQTFKELSDFTDRANVGSRRIKKYYIYSNEDGSVKKFTGILESDFDSRNNSALVAVDGINRKVKALYSDFRQTYRKGDAIDIVIAFNFIGPVALPSKSF